MHVPTRLQNRNRVHLICSILVLAIMVFAVLHKVWVIATSFFLLQQHNHARNGDSFSQRSLDHLLDSQCAWCASGEQVWCSRRVLGLADTQSLPFGLVVQPFCFAVQAHSPAQCEAAATYSAASPNRTSCPASACSASKREAPWLCLLRSSAAMKTAVVVACGATLGMPSSRRTC